MHNGQKCDRKNMQCFFANVFKIFILKNCFSHFNNKFTKDKEKVSIDCDLLITLHTTYVLILNELTL